MRSRIRKVLEHAPKGRGSSQARSSSRSSSPRWPELSATARPYAAAHATRRPIRRRRTRKETEIIANVSTYGTRQSNKSTNGGGAVYGCRSGAGGTPKGNEPCIRANNLASGLAFEFNSTNAAATQVGSITATNANAAPFTTNATGVATGLNADKVDGKDASDLQAKFATVAADGTLAAGARGAKTVAHTAGVGQSTASSSTAT